MRLPMLARFTRLVPVVLLSGAFTAGAQERVVLLDDDYSGMVPGMISAGVIGAHAEYHYLAATEPRGNWTVSTFRSPGSQRGWRLIEENGERLILQGHAPDERDRAYNHPMLVAGDSFWTDYTVEVRFAPANDTFQSGLAFRYQTDRAYYFAGVVGQKVVLKKVSDGPAFRTLKETVLAEQALKWTPGEFIRLKVTATGEELTAEFGATLKLSARDPEFRQGKTGFTSDVPTKFGRVRVTCSPETRTAIDKARQQHEIEEKRLQQKNPPMVVWKRIETAGFGVGRNLRFGDLNSDGQLDILVAQVDPLGPGDSHCQVGCLTALTLDGKRLWQNGIPDPWRDHLTSDVGVQIHDLDGDGRNDVIYCRGMEIIVADGATGKTKYKAPTPDSPDTESRKELYPRILGDCLYFCDFRGLGQKRDFVIKDRYRNLWAYNDKLQPMWHVALNTGHYPYASDIDNDGKDELAIGYSLIDDDGTVIWSLDSQLQDHADGVAILRHRDDQPLRFQCAASDEGFFFADLKGHVLRHHQIGHAQNPSVADYRPDLPGLETVTVNFWGNQGIVSFFDAEGNRYHTFEPAQHGSMMLPLNWTGDGQEFWILSPNPTFGGAYDGWGRRVLRFPADGHPDLCVASLDMTGDCRDEIVVWDPWEIWIYTQADSPKAGRLYKPRRNSLSNYSNYQTTVSQPGWWE